MSQQRIRFWLCFLTSILASVEFVHGSTSPRSPQNNKRDQEEQLTTVQQLPLHPNFQAGDASPIPGFPKLPSISIDASQFPPLDQIPPTDSEFVKKWLAKIDLSKAPNARITGENGCTNTTFNSESIAKAGADGNCWWTCGGCTREADISTCPNKGVWGASYDDGPSPYTPNILEYLDKHQLKATFFVVGSRAISYPEILQAEYMASHQQCLHTWSHRSLTTLTNEEIVAEFAWTMKAFEDIIGVVPKCARAPYGDVDDRVRYVLKSMGLNLIFWTSANGVVFDTNDWRVQAGSINAADAVESFDKILATQSSLQTGFIVLAHDLFEKTVALSLNAFLPGALKANLTITDIGNCLGESPSQSFLGSHQNSSSSHTPADPKSSTAHDVVVNSTTHDVVNSTTHKPANTTANKQANSVADKDTQANASQSSASQNLEVHWPMVLLCFTSVVGLLFH